MNTISISNYLLRDIQHFYLTKEQILSLYYDRNKHLLEYEAYADKYWLVSDILLYMKKTAHPQRMKTSKFYNKNIIYTNTIFNQVNYFWAKLDASQREDFLSIRKKK
jgi:hypothetical protein